MLQNLLSAACVKSVLLWRVGIGFGFGWLVFHSVGKLNSVAIYKFRLWLTPSLRQQFELSNVDVSIIVIDLLYR